MYDGLTAERRGESSLTTVSGEEAGLVEIADEGMADGQLGQQVGTVNERGLEKE